MNKINLYFCIASVACSLVACRTAYPMQGMIYDQDSRPVPGYKLTLDSWQTVTTDINGRFTFGTAKYGNHTVAGSDERYLPFSEKCQFAGKTEILHIRLSSIDRLYCTLDDEIASGELFRAAKSLDLLPEKEHGTNRFKLYDAILRYRLTGNRTVVEGVKPE